MPSATTVTPATASAIRYHTEKVLKKNKRNWCIKDDELISYNLALIPVSFDLEISS